MRLAAMTQIADHLTYFELGNSKHHAETMNLLNNV